MKSSLECLPCLGRNVIDAARRASGNTAVQHRIARDGFNLLAECGCRMPPPYYAGEIFKIVRNYVDDGSLYASEKHHSNAVAEKILQKLCDSALFDPSDFESRLRLAVAGNILDFGIFQNLDISEALNAVDQALSLPLDRQAICRLHERIDSAEKILYILDNCGEAVFDREFLAPFRHKVILGVRGGEVFNDVTMDDLAECGLDGFTRQAVSSGCALPGTVIELCSAGFQEIFNSVDLIISKGQGNFETLNESDRPIAFLFMAKCPVVANLLGVTQGEIQVRIVNF